jgi:hypothetical protein
MRNTLNLPTAQHLDFFSVLASSTLLVYFVDSLNSRGLSRHNGPPSPDRHCHEGSYLVGIFGFVENSHLSGSQRSSSQKKDLVPAVPAIPVTLHCFYLNLQ